jgi:hypothetical protein
MTSICTKCATVKDVSGFHADKSRKSAVASWCKECKGKSIIKSCASCKEDYSGSRHSKNCQNCIDTKPSSELYNRKKPVSKCATCEKQARSSACKYCEDCSDNRKMEYNRTYMKNKRTDPIFIEKERIYLQKYCEDKGITMVELWGEIYDHRLDQEIVREERA